VSTDQAIDKVARAVAQSETHLNSRVGGVRKANGALGARHVVLDRVLVLSNTENQQAMSVGVEVVNTLNRIFQSDIFHFLQSLNTEYLFSYCLLS
jgi:hypothetical protein